MFLQAKLVLDLLMLNNFYPGQYFRMHFELIRYNRGLKYAGIKAYESTFH